MSDKNNCSAWFFKSLNQYLYKRVSQSTEKQSALMKGPDTFLQQANGQMLTILPSQKTVSSANLIPVTLNSTPKATSANVFSTKVFIGGIPLHATEDDIIDKFSQFGPLEVYWPKKEENDSKILPKGYVFILFEYEYSVYALVDNCIKKNNNLYLCMSSEVETFKVIEIRPWYVSDLWYIEIDMSEINMRNTVFIGGFPRPIKAAELAMQMRNLYGGVCYASIDTESNLNYPRNSGRVVFYSSESHKAAIEDRFVTIWNGRINKKAEVKPFVLPDQHCDICESSSSWDEGNRTGNILFCPNKACLQYYCKDCWLIWHSDTNKETHKPIIQKKTRGNCLIVRFC